MSAVTNEVSAERVVTYGSGAAEFATGDFRVSVRHANDDKHPGATEYAAQLADHATAITVANFRVAAFLNENTALRRTVEDLEGKVASLRAQVRELKGETPTTLMGPGTVRFTRAGDLWILNKRETGWASFGFRLDGWDELFRRFKVVVTEHGVDEHGAYWVVSNVRSA